MAVPVFKWEAAFGSLPGDATPTWVADLTKNVGGNSYTRGKNADLDRIEAGTGGLILLDDAGDFDPRNTGGPYYPDVRPMAPIRQYATLGGVDYPLCQHFIQRMPRTRVAGMVTRQIVTVDGFAMLATAPLAGLDLTAGGSGAQVTAILDYIGWPSALRVIATGAASLIETSFAASDTTKALAYLQNIAANEAGLLFMDGQGRVVFIGRGDLLGPPFNAIQAHFSDDPRDGQFVYQSSVSDFSSDLVWNDWTGTRPGGDPQNANDSTSQDRYGARSQSVSMLVPNDTDVLNTMQHYLGLYKEPVERLTSISVIPGEDSAYWVTVLLLDVGARVTVTETFPWGKRADDYLIEKVTCARGPGSDSGAAFTYALIPATSGADGFRLDDPVLGQLDLNGLGF